mmetsp:Transcript_34899/g.35541  ORF Transcript_34899/g.35541 Transcript_34899/m.35541 type:complete len:189 (-) Transcript_34899:62-628(-)
MLCLVNTKKKTKAVKVVDDNNDDSDSNSDDEEYKCTRSRKQSHVLSMSTNRSTRSSVLSRKAKAAAEEKTSNRPIGESDIDEEADFSRDPHLLHDQGLLMWLYYPDKEDSATTIGNIDGEYHFASVVSSIKRGRTVKFKISWENNIREIEYWNLNEVFKGLEKYKDYEKSIGKKNLKKGNRRSEMSID